MNIIVYTDHKNTKEIYGILGKSYMYHGYNKTDGFYFIYGNVGDADLVYLRNKGFRVEEHVQAAQ